MDDPNFISVEPEGAQYSNLGIHLPQCKIVPRFSLHVCPDSLVINQAHHAKSYLTFLQLFFITDIQIMNRRYKSLGTFFVYLTKYSKNQSS